MREEKGGGGGGLSESGRIFEKNIPGYSEMMNPHSMFYNIIGEEILFTALIYLRSSWAGIVMSTELSNCHSDTTSSCVNTI